MRVALGAQLPVRLEDDVDKRLEAVAKNAGTSKSALIRLLAKTFVEHVVQADGSVKLPPDWRELLAPADGRAVMMEGKDAKVPPARLVNYRSKKPPEKKSAAAQLPKKAAGET